MQIREQIYEGKAKQLLQTDDAELVVQRFKDSATAFNGEKYAEFAGKGATNNAISTFLFQKLEAAGIATHFVAQLDARDQLVRRLDIIPLEVVVRNVVAGSLARRTGLEEGVELREPIVETYYKADALGDPLLADTHVHMLELATREELDAIKRQALAINDTLAPIFEAAGMRLVDFKLEFGRDAQGRLVLGDEISPDTCRLWDLETKRKLDKDVFRRNLGDLMDVYHEVAARLGVAPAA